MCLFLTTKYKELLKTIRKVRRVLEIASVLTTTTKFTPKYNRTTSRFPTTAS